MKALRLRLHHVLVAITVASGAAFALVASAWSCAAFGPPQDRLLVLPGGLNVITTAEGLSLSTIHYRDYRGKLMLEPVDGPARGQLNRFIDGSLLDFRWRFCRIPGGRWDWYVVLPIRPLLVSLSLVAIGASVLRRRLDRLPAPDGFGVPQMERDNDAIAN